MDILCASVIRESGVPVYFMDFADLFKDTDFSLVSSFFSANVQFSQQIIKEKIKVLELGSFRFFFRYYKNLIFIVITSNTASALLIHERMDRIVEIMEKHYDLEKLINEPHMVENSDLNQEIKKIVNLQDDFSESLIKPIKNLFDQEIFAGEIAAAAILSLKGKIYYSSLPIIDLHTALKELEIRVQAQSQELLINPKLIWQTKKKLIFTKAIKMPHFHKLVYIILLFDSKVNLGMADYCLEDICNKLNEIDK